MKEIISETTTHKVRVCETCEGKGVTVEHILTDYHKRNYAEKRESCFECRGSGRVMITTNVTVMPYVQEKEIK